jgi:hypothetical protein
VEVFVEIAKFILTAVGTFLSVFALSFTVFQYWRKKQDEKFESLSASVEVRVRNEEEARKEAMARMDKRLEFLEQSVLHGFESRLSNMEGELRVIRSIVKSIQDWFVNNTPGGK